MEIIHWRRMQIMCLLILAGLAAFPCRYSQERFTGSRVKNPDAYLLDI